MRSPKSAWILASITLCCLLACSFLRPPIAKVWADESTYLAMISSLAEDHDLRFDERDVARIDTSERSRGHLILQRSGDRITYSKPPLSALFAAPFYFLAGDWALIVVNMIAFLLAIASCIRWLAVAHDQRATRLALVTFLGASVLVPYLFWRMSDSLQASLVLIGLSLSLQPSKPGRRPTLDLVGCSILGLTIMMRVSNVFLAFIPALAAALERRYRRAILFGVVTTAAWALTALAAIALTDTANPYRAERTTFNADTGYPAGEQLEAASQRFSSQPARHLNPPVPSLSDRRSIFSTIYFLAGRHTGILFYFPAALLFVLCALRRLDARSGAVLLGVAALAAFFLIWKPANYFGGSTFIGNRYFLPAYAALLFAPRRLPTHRSLTLVWCLALIVSASALFSQWQYRALNTGSQGHTLAPLFRAAPFETTGQFLDGRRDRYWAGHFVGFHDPFADVSEGWFDLFSDRPATELTIAHWESPGPIRLLVDCHASQAALEITDYSTSTTQPLTCPRSDVLVELSRPWRRHAYWWNLDILQYSRTIGIRYSGDGSSDGTPAAARITYLGTPSQHRLAYNYELVEENCPREVLPGSSSVILFEIKNTSSRIWKAIDSTAMRQNFSVIDAEGRLLSSSSRSGIDRDIAPGESLHTRFEVQWPDESTELTLQLDLELDNFASFSEELGTPIFTSTVAVAPTARP